jgi:hypothetical protein
MLVAAVIYLVSPNVAASLHSGGSAISLKPGTGSGMGRNRHAIRRAWLRLNSAHKLPGRAGQWAARRTCFVKLTAPLPLTAFGAGRLA